ncbi:hypothetical protein BX661DRAFT_54207 [Kickxella alabastrina]|uniref:uncharacterized protein n=1 Tax=Kickxella alabastrina TaxID=61397 RepID=UPI00221FD4A5|nr:uncharacterized protein BX661DRAFT_54207 [Kickxella alabastrina]KAI7823654.1 hypothetical protein BX661DRAFT_54207 [Kickxella alabastrina]
MAAIVSGSGPGSDIHSSRVQLLASADADQVYQALRAIKNSVIGSSSKKALYLQLQVVPAVGAVLTSSVASAASRVQATAIVSSLVRSSGADGAAAASALAAGGVVAALVQQLGALDAPPQQPGLAGASPQQLGALVETSERALNALLAHRLPALEADDAALHALLAHLLALVAARTWRRPGSRTATRAPSWRC